ncbi:SDR family NAD(P)-dependent oxidoreductase [Cellulosilyticum ruminicola]|uniref:SDR family NAD(P)-dependent oxidoreductase n=1 Tax=Cellulosilyticum ruminicola TaxID=425254 RepID=UPI001FA6BFB1|nr:SDR family oxidoreductase [Cellulosilyticum ruminicola]
MKADITDSECIEQLKKEVTNKYKSINGMILAAGILEVKNFKNTTLEDWNRTLEINLTANYMICKALVDNIIACGGGHIIFIGSVMSKVAGYDLLTYSVSKAGVAHLAANLALDLLNEEIYVNCICPGFMNTEMYQKVNQAPEKNINWIHTLAGLKNKFVRIEDIVNLIYFLINQQSINGQAIIVDNGYSIR